MHGDGHIHRPFGKSLIDHGHIIPFEAIHVEAAGDIPGSFFLRAEFPPAGIVELQISASRLVKGRDGLLIGGGDVRKKRVIVSISLKGLVLLIPDGGNEVKHGRGGNGELGWRVPGKCLYSLEVFNKRMTTEADFGDDFDGFRLGLTFLESNGALFSRNFPDAVEVPEEIEMPPAAAVFSVGDGTEAEGFLFGYELGDFGVFDLAELPLGYPPLRKALPCLFEASLLRKLPTIS